MKLPKFPTSAAHSNVAELGESHVALGQFTVRGGAIVLERFGFEQVLAVHPSEGGENDAAIRTASAIAPRIGMHGALALVVPSHWSLTKFIDVPALPRAKLRKVIQFEAAQQIPYPLSEVVWDYGVIAEAGSHLNIVLTAAKLEAMQNLCAVLDEAGFQVERATPAGVALAHAFRHNYPEAEGAALVVEVGSRSTLLLFIDAERFLVRTLMLARGAAGAPRESGDDFRRRLQQEVSRSLVAMRRQANLIEPMRVYVAGEFGEVETLGPVLEAQCKCQVERFDALRQVELSNQAEAAGARSYSSRLASFVGLGVIAAKQPSGVPNVVPERWSCEMASRRRFPLLIAAAGLIGVSILPAALHFRSVEQREREEIQRLDTTVRSLRQFAAKNAEHLIAIENLEGELAGSESLLKSRTSWVRFFADLQAKLAAVEDVWLEKLVVVDGSAQPHSDERDELRAPEPLRLAVSGRMLKHSGDPATPSSSHEKVKQLLATLRSSEFVDAIEGERFDDTEPDFLRFDFTIVARAESHL